MEKEKGEGFAPSAFFCKKVNYLAIVLSATAFFDFLAFLAFLAFLPFLAVVSAGVASELAGATEVAAAGAAAAGSSAIAATAKDAAMKAARTILIVTFMKRSFKRLIGW